MAVAVPPWAAEGIGVAESGWREASRIAARGVGGVGGSPREAHGSSIQGTMSDVRRGLSARRWWVVSKLAGSATSVLRELLPE